jgi:hypothetical protein
MQKSLVLFSVESSLDPSRFSLREIILDAASNIARNLEDQPLENFFEIQLPNGDIKSKCDIEEGEAPIVRKIGFR